MMTSKSFGNWICEKVLGSGGFGQVELWKEKYTSKRIAIKKCMLPKNTITPRQMERWQQEIENMKNFKHPNIVKSELVPKEMIFDSPVLCMEFCNKGDLRKVLNQPENTCGLVQNEVLSVMKDVSSALMYLHHNNITHRDIKPENIVLHKKHGMIIYKLIDLGYAKELGSVTTTASLVGTFNYVAPELFWKKKYTCSVDYWSLGILFFEVLTGYKPFIPYQENLKSWITNMQKKNYQEICAKEINEGIKFYDHIIYPHDLSKNTSDSMIDWFRLALQWDPRQRGKRPQSDEVVIFSLLKEIFPRQAIYVFSVSLYRIDQYDITSSTTLAQLQQWIEQKTSVFINEQLITDTKGNIFNKNKSSEHLISEIIPDSILYVYKNEYFEVNEFDNSYKLPEILNIMLLDSTAINDRSLLRQCYTSVIYIMRQEVMLFQHFTFALGIKLDILNQQLNILSGKICESLPNTKLLLNEVEHTLIVIRSKIVLDERINQLQNLFSKIKVLYSSLNNLNNEAEKFQHISYQIKDFFDKENLLKNMQKYSQLYEEFLSIFHTFENQRIHTAEQVSKHVNNITYIFSQFEQQKAIQFQDQEMLEIISQFTHFEKKLNLRLEVLNSCMKLIPFYKHRFTEILNMDNLYMNIQPPYQVSNIASSLVTSEDNEIKDNIVLRTLFDKYLQDIQDSFTKSERDFK